MNKLMKYAVLILLFNSLFSSQINENLAIEVAENFYFSKNDPRSSEFLYEEITLYNYENNEIFYVVSLEPMGFILISSDNLIRPILAYSFNENFMFSENIPVNLKYLFNLYSEELVNQRRSNMTDDEIAAFLIEERENQDYNTLAGIMIGVGFLLILISFGARRKKKGGAKRTEKKPTN